MEHRYAVGDRVSLASGLYDTDAIGLYVVTRQLPFVVGGEPRYRVRPMTASGSLASRRFKERAGRPIGRGGREVRIAQSPTLSIAFRLRRTSQRPPTTRTSHAVGVSA